MSNLKLENAIEYIIGSVSLLDILSSKETH